MFVVSFEVDSCTLIRSWKLILLLTHLNMATDIFISAREIAQEGQLMTMLMLVLSMLGFFFILAIWRIGNCSEFA